MVKVKLLDGKMPQKAYSSAGWDLFAVEDTFLEPGIVTFIRLGISTEFPAFLVGKIEGKSGLGKKGVSVLGGVIDADYRGEWVVLLINHGEETVKIEKGKAVAQVLFLTLMRTSLEVVTELSDTQRGSGGFGSSGF